MSNDKVLKKTFKFRKVKYLRRILEWINQGNIAGKRRPG